MTHRIFVDKKAECHLKMTTKLHFFKKYLANFFLLAGFIYNKL